MKANYRDDDLFKEGTMTFGEHLEELRSCLFKAVSSLVLGFIIGLCIGGWIVRRIQDPLEAALTNLYVNRSVDKYLKEAELREKNGGHVPEDMKDREKLRDLILKEKLLAQEFYISPLELLEELKKAYPGKFDDVKLPKSGANDGISRSKMLRLFLWRPHEDDERLRAEGLSVQEPFVMYIKASLIAGIVLASPFIFYFLWSFVAAGLYPNEKKYVHVFLPFSVALFLAGALMAYFFVFPPGLTYFFWFSESLNQEQRPRISEWLDFVLMLPLAFGISFQLPLVMLFMERIGMFTAKDYLSKWRIAVLVMSIVAMVLSPGGDPNSMMLMLVPIIFLYFGGVGLCKWLPSMRPAEANAS